MLYSVVFVSAVQLQISYMYTHIPSPLSLPLTPAIPPLQVIIEHRAELDSSFPPAICFTHGSVYKSMLHSSIHPAFSLLPCREDIFRILLAVWCLVAQSCPTLCNPMDCRKLGSSVHVDSPGKNTGVGCHTFLQGIFPTWGSDPGLPHCRRILYHLYLWLPW